MSAGKLDLGAFWFPQKRSFLVAVMGFERSADVKSEISCVELGKLPEFVWCVSSGDFWNSFVTNYNTVQLNWQQVRSCHWSKLSRSKNFCKPKAPKSVFAGGNFTFFSLMFRVDKLRLEKEDTRKKVMFDNPVKVPASHVTVIHYATYLWN